MQHHNRQTGFTLVELLVVITIISLLMALILPSIQESRAVAQKTLCMSRERNIATAFVNYLQANRDTYPYANPSKSDTYPYVFGSTNNNRPWMFVLSPYLGDYRNTDFPAVLRCPADYWQPFSNGNQQYQPPSSYGMNSHVFPANWGDSSGNDPTVVASARRAAKTNFSIRSPGETLLLGELVNGANLPFASGASWTGGNTITNTLLTNGVYMSAPYWVTEEIGTISTASNTIKCTHKRGWNSLFVDGHVRYDTRAALRSMPSVFWNG